MTQVIVACEYSGAVRDAFIAHGVDAMSVDLLPTDQPGPHYQGDIFDVDFTGVQLVIAHPPCTFLTNAGVRHLHSIPSRNGVLPKIHGAERWAEMRSAGAFFRRLLDLPVPMIAVENPIPHRYAIEEIGRKYDQIIQPWMHGHPETKATCLWLKNLPPLMATADVRDAMMKLDKRDRNRIHNMAPSADRWKLRSTTYAGIAAAMAAQWAPLITREDQS
jgi:hypothetical protein